MKGLYLVCTVAVFLVASSLLAGCEPHPSTCKKANMTALSPRLQPLFEKTKTVCFGRFLIDVREITRVVWGTTDVPLGVALGKAAARN